MDDNAESGDTHQEATAVFGKIAPAEEFTQYFGNGGFIFQPFFDNLSFKKLGKIFDHAFNRFQNAISGKTISYNHVNLRVKDVVAFNVSDKIKTLVLF